MRTMWRRSSTRSRGPCSIRLIASSDFGWDWGTVKQDGRASASAFDVDPALFLFGDYFGDPCGNGFGAGDEVGEGEFASFHGVFAGFEMDEFFLQALDVRENGGRGLEDGDS